jgi:hypothetical protein
MAEEPKKPKKKVLERIVFDKATIGKSKPIENAFIEWSQKGDDLAEAIKESGKAKETLKALVGAKAGVKEGAKWDIVKNDSDGFDIEVIEKAASERSRIPTRKGDF